MRTARSRRAPRALVRTLDLVPVDLDPGRRRHQGVLRDAPRAPAAVPRAVLQLVRHPLHRELVVPNRGEVHQEDAPVVHVGRQVADVLLAVNLRDPHEVLDGLSEGDALLLQRELREVDVRTRLRGDGTVAGLPKPFLDEGHPNPFWARIRLREFKGIELRRWTIAIHEFRSIIIIILLSVDSCSPRAGGPGERLKGVVLLSARPWSTTSSSSGAGPRVSPRGCMPGPATSPPWSWRRSRRGASSPGCTRRSPCTIIRATSRRRGSTSAGWSSSMHGCAGARSGGGGRSRGGSGGPGG